MNIKYRIPFCFRTSQVLSFTFIILILSTLSSTALVMTKISTELEPWVVFSTSAFVRPSKQTLPLEAITSGVPHKGTPFLCSPGSAFYKIIPLPPVSHINFSEF